MRAEPLPPQYGWLLNLKDAPAILAEGLKLYGIKEIPGPESNSVIIGWAKNLKNWISSWYVNDDTPWCGLFIAELCRRAGLPVVKEPLRALAWGDWGRAVPRPMLADLLGFKREGGGHVGIYIGEDAAAYYVLGGNQGNAVSITRILKNHLVFARRTAWGSAGQPACVKVIELKASGELSQNEA